MKKTKTELRKNGITINLASGVVSVESSDLTLQEVASVAAGIAAHISQRCRSANEFR